jgi:hypothetical protein
MRGRFAWVLVAISLLLSSIAACNSAGEFIKPLRGSIQPPSSSQLTPTPELETVFRVTIPEPLPEGGQIALDIVDEITGLALNPSRHMMREVIPKVYETRINLKPNTLLKYRYIRQGKSPALEYTAGGQQTRYRMYFVQQEKIIIEDQVYAWGGQPYTGAYGRIEGQITNRITEKPIGSIMIVVDGAQAFTSADGKFLLDNLSPGKHNLVAVHLDNLFKPFQQEALVSPDAMTPAVISMEPLKTIDVTFNVSVPVSTPEIAGVYLLGDTFQLGNMFNDLSGGVSISTAHAPLMTKIAPNRYSIKVNLPVGAPIKYKYSLGDGFWNAEHDATGGYVVHELRIVDDQETVEDTVYSWQMGKTAPISFDIVSPELPFEGEYPSIQLNPFGWMEPIPMWKEKDNHWKFTLFSPLEMLGDVQYRFCLNGICPETSGYVGGKSYTGKFSVKGENLSPIEGKIEKWGLTEKVELSLQKDDSTAPSRGENFITGVELTSDFQVSRNANFETSAEYLKGLGAGWVIVSPTWTASNDLPPYFEIIPGRNALQPELIHTSQTIISKDMRLVIFPRLTFLGSDETWWKNGTRDSSWWQTWFDRYRMFLIQNATLANEIHASAIILGDPSILPALPDGKLKDGSPSNLPVDSEGRWVQLIKEIRSIYKGPLIWATAYPYSKDNIPPFIQQLDQVYVLWSASLQPVENSQETDLVKIFSTLLDQDLNKLFEATKKPIILGISYGSYAGSRQGCDTPDGICKARTTESNQPDFQEQAELYRAGLTAASQKPWINGFISRGFDPTAPLMDESASIYQKPAAVRLGIWFKQIKTQPN